jgi:hypothetical protein
MICSIYRGGLGNQLFQVATGIHLANSNNDKYVIDVHNFEGMGQGKRIENYLDTVFCNVHQGDSVCNYTYRHEGISTQYKCVPYKTDMCLDGFFQSELFFENNRQYFSELFNFTSSEQHDNYVCIQVRGGDYRHKGHEHFNVITPTYFTNSIEKVKSIADNSRELRYFVVTDDIDYANTLLPNTSFEHVNTHELDQLKFMSRCKYCIISASSFGWWGSYFGLDKITIAPSMWKTDSALFSPDIYRHDMIKINC